MNKRNSRGFAHHFIVPVLAIVAVGAIGLVTLRMSSAASSYKGSCTKKTYSVGSKSECVRDIQKMVGASADAAYGSETAAKVKDKIGGTGKSVTPAKWTKLCNYAYKYYLSNSTKRAGYQHACLGYSQKNATTAIKVKECSYTHVVYPKNPKNHYSCKTVYVATKAEKDKIKNASADKTAQYKADKADYDTKVGEKVLADIANRKRRCQTDSSEGARWNAATNKCE